MAHLEDEVLTKPTHFNFAQDVIDSWARKQPNAQAMKWVSQDFSEAYSLSFKYFENQSHRIAHLLRGLGIHAGQVILIILPRVPAWWELALAALRSGIIFCPATTLLVEGDIKYRCLETRAVAFIGDSGSVRKFQRVRSQCPDVKHLMQIDAHEINTDTSVLDFYLLLRSVRRDAVFDGPKTLSTDPALIYFTSGTSGPPKMVRHNHISYPLAHTLTGKHWLQLRPGRLYWNISEQGWAKAAYSFLSAWNCGASLFVYDDQRAFNPTRVLEILHRYPITTLCAPPTAYRQLTLQHSQEYMKKFPPLTLSHCAGAGEPLNASVIQAWQEMTGMEIYDGYGQTETVLICGNFPGSPIKPGSMGRPMPGVPLKVITLSGVECEAGVEGEIALLVESGKCADHHDFFGLFDGYQSRDGTLQRRISKFGDSSWYLGKARRGVESHHGYP